MRRFLALIVAANNLPSLRYEQRLRLTQTKTARNVGRDFARAAKMPWFYKGTRHHDHDHFCSLTQVRAAKSQAPPMNGSPVMNVHVAALIKQRKIAKTLVRTLAMIVSRGGYSPNGLGIRWV